MNLRRFGDLVDQIITVRFVDGDMLTRVCARVRLSLQSLLLANRDAPG